MASQNLYHDGFSEGAALRPYVLSKRMVYGSDADALVDNALFAWDATNVTPTLDFIGNRPCIALTNTGSTATDGAQAQVTVGCYQPQASKLIQMKFSLRMSATTQEFSFGFAAIDTSIIASAPTDEFALQKLTGVTSPVVRARKASGTAQTSNSLGITFAADTWYDFTLELIRDPDTAGKGLFRVYGAASLAAGGTMDLLFSEVFGTQVPDTVDLAPYFAWRAGSAANVSGYIGHFGWIIQG